MAGLREAARGSEEFFAAHGLGPCSPASSFEDRITLTWAPEVHVVGLGGHACGSSVVFVPSCRDVLAGDLVFAKSLAWVGDADRGGHVGLALTEAAGIEVLVVRRGRSGRSLALGRRDAVGLLPAPDAVGPLALPEAVDLPLHRPDGERPHIADGAVDAVYVDGLGGLKP